MPCHCIDCSKDPKPTYTDAFKYECYLRFIASHDSDWIKEYLKGVEQMLGSVARDKLRWDVWKMLKKK